MAKKMKSALLHVLIVVVFLCGMRKIARADGKEYTWLIEPKYEDAARFSEDLWAVKKNGLWGYVDSADNVVIDFQYLKASIFRNGRALVTVSSDLKDMGPTIQLIINKGGQSLYGPRPEVRVDWLYPAGDITLVPFYDSQGKYGFINLSDDKVQIPAVYEEIRGFTEGMGMVKSDKHWGAIDTNGKWIIPPRYKTLLQLRNGHIPFRLDSDLWGVMNAEEKVIIEPKYTSISPGRVWRIELDGKIGYMDESLAVLVPPKYEKVTGSGVYPDQYRAGIAFVYNSGKFMALNEKGKTMFEFSRSIAEPAWGGQWNVEGHYVLRTQGLGIKDFLVNRMGETILSPEFDQLRPSEDGVIAVQKGKFPKELWGLIKLRNQ